MVSAIDPVAGFLAVVAFAPLGHLAAVTVSVENFRMAEAVTLAFFAGWLLHGWTDRDGPRMPRWIAPLLAAAVAASVAGLAWQLARRGGDLRADVDLLVHAYNIADDRFGFTAGARLVEGLALAAATVTLFRCRPRLAVLVPAVLAGGGVAAAAASGLLWYGVAPAAVLRDYLRNRYRVVAHVPDANAAGSAFAMLTCLSIGMALRARGRSRALWIAAAGANGFAVWLSASRSALAATVAGVVLFAVWWTAAHLRSRRAALVAAGICLVASVAGAGYMWRLSRDQLSRGSTLRAQFNETSERMIAARPLVGVGIGQYYRQSSLFMTPQLAWFYGSENAHNYFLQIAAELGVPGLVLFGGLFVAALWRTARAAARQPRDPRLVGVGCGVVAFLGTAFVSHPFLVDEVALPFWVQFGLLVGLADAWRDRGTPAGDRASARALTVAVAAAAAAYVVLSPVLRVWRGTPAPPQDQAVDGFYGWETDASGTRYRWSGEYASVFTPGGVTRVDVPVRIPDGARGLPTIVVTPSVEGRHRATVPVTTSWTTIEVDLPPPWDAARTRRIDLRVGPSAWQPAVHIAGNADLRHVGVEVGDCLFRR